MHPTLKLLDPLASRLREGQPSLILSRLPDKEHHPKEGWWRFVDEEENFLAWGLIDREHDRVVLLSDDADSPKEGFVRRFFESVRRRSFAPEQAHRLINGTGDGLGGFQFDRLHQVGILKIQGWGFQPLVDILKNHFETLAEELEMESLVLKVLPKGGTSKGRLPQQVLFGDTPPETLQIREGQRRMLVRPMGAINTGIFPDLRGIREEIVQNDEGKRLLNLFSYTGAFALAAAFGKAAAVTSVDAAKGLMEWARANVELNNGNPDALPYRWQRGDVFENLNRYDKRGEVFDTVIVDPPARSRSGYGRFFLKSDYPKLLASCLRILTPGGRLIVTDHTRTTSPERLGNHLRKAGELAGRELDEPYYYESEADYPVHELDPKSRSVLALKIDCKV